jgi:hypothetical protein
MKKIAMFFTAEGVHTPELVPMSMQKELTEDLPGNTINEMILEIGRKFNKPVVHSWVLMTVEEVRRCPD